MCQQQDVTKVNRKNQGKKKLKKKKSLQETHISRNRPGCGCLRQKQNMITLFMMRDLNASALEEKLFDCGYGIFESILIEARYAV